MSERDAPTTHAVSAKIVIEDTDVSSHWRKIEWKAAINNGYVVRAKLDDAYFNVLKQITDLYYLKKARNEPVKVTFNIMWIGDEKLKTEDRIAYIVGMKSVGSIEYGSLEFVAIDPPTWLLSRGESSGKYYEGSVSDVIKKVCQENGVSDVEVTKTIDNSKGSWWMMRQDPKTFILSLLDWSSSITPNKTKWIVNSKDMKLIVKEEHALKSEDLGQYIISPKSGVASDIIDFEVMMDNFTHVWHSEEHTAGMSAISGYHIDKVTEKDKSRLYDGNTGGKSNTSFGSDRGFKKPSKKFSTFRHAIPEDSAGIVGINYKDYIDGVARQEYLDMLTFVMRMRVAINGSAKFDDPTQLGVSTITLRWIGSDMEPYFLSSHWMVYGFWHVVDPAGWKTNLFINRLDYDASAKKVGPNAG